MKYISIALLFAFCTINVVAQKDSKEIKVGEPLPSLPLGKVMDNVGNLSSEYKGAKNFSDFKNKLIVLDFWTTYCSSCIAGFEKMSKLQSQFGDQIQIFLVNKSEDESKIKNWLAIQNKKRFPEKIIPENLPVIANAKELGQFFPTRGGIGYHVWIGPDGIVKLRGISENTHERKIAQLLAGEQVSFIQDNEFAYKGHAPFFNSKSTTRSTFSSAFGPFDDKNASSYGVQVRDYRDSVSKTKRNSHINLEILQLYDFALELAIKNDTSLLFGKPIEIGVNNKAIITQDERLLNRKAIDDDFLNKISYEQIVPINLSDTIVKEFMLADLNRYLYSQYGISGNWERRSVKCLKLVQTGDLSQIKSKQHSRERNLILKDSVTSIEYKGYPLKSLFKDYFSLIGIDFDTIIIDGVGLDTPIDLTLPSSDKIKNYQMLLNELRSVGFSLTRGSVTRNLFVIKKAG